MDTEMILAYSDIERIILQGHELEDFMYYDGFYWRLKNIEGKCVFLRNDGRCEVYRYRPLGCRAYPIVLDEKHDCVLDDEICPYAYAISKDEFLEGCRILSKFFRNLGEKPPRDLLLKNQ